MTINLYNKNYKIYPHDVPGSISANFGLKYFTNRVLIFNKSVNPSKYKVCRTF